MKKTNDRWPFWFVLTLLFFVFVISVPGWGVERVSGQTLYNVPAATAKVKIDGILNEEVWQEALVLELNYEVEPGENIAPPVKTQVLLIYGPNHLYAAFRAYDPNPSEIRARVTDRDNTWEDDYVGIILDTFNDSRRTYEFYCNPYGIQADKIGSTMGGGEDWDAIWNSAGRLNKDGYIVEMAIPFSSLRFQRRKGHQVWGIDAVRSFPRNLSHLIGLFPRDRSNNCYMCQAEKIIGFSGAKPGKNIELDPTLSALLTQERENFPEGKFVEKSSKVDPGLTARWGFTPNLTLSAAVNPDFSQVEADAAQLDINTQFALYYPEKRPFFQEGASIFMTQFAAIYTRTVIDPNWGIKLTGKEGKNAIGFFTVQDNSTYFLFPTSQSSESVSLDMKNISTALRYRRDVGKASNLGIVISNREGENYYSRLAGVDGDLMISKRDRMVFQFLGSQTRYPDHVVSRFHQPEGKITGSAFTCVYRHATQNVVLFGHYQRVTPYFRADVGFADQTGTSMVRGGGGYTWRRNPGHWYTLLNIFGRYRHMRDEDNNLLQKRFQGIFTYNGPLQSLLTVTFNIGKMGYMEKEFRDNSMEFTAQLRPSGALLLGFNGAFGDRVDFNNVQAGTRIRFNPVVQYKIGRRTYLGLDHLFEQLDVDGGRLYTANLSNLRLVYQFNSRAFLRVILQYAHFKYNTELYTFPIDPLFKHLFSQVLFSYKINPQTVLFLGYSDDYYGYMHIPLKQNNRTFFLKIGYALVI